jgi:CBS domain-containing protein
LPVSCPCGYSPIALDTDAREGLLAIRRAAVTLCAPWADERHLVGIVTDVALRDRGYEHAVDVAGAAMITGVLGRDRVARGETVGLRFEASGCYVFPSGAVGAQIHDP